MRSRRLLSRFSPQVGLAAAFGLAMAVGAQVPPPQDPPAQVPQVETVPTQEPAPILPGVPASRDDPAPPGTRAIPADPNAVGRTRPATPAGRSPNANVNAKNGRFQSFEGVVTELKPATADSEGGTTGANPLIRLVVDPSQTWEDFAIGGAAMPEPSTEAASEAPVPTAEPAPQPAAAEAEPAPADEPATPGAEASEEQSPEPTDLPTLKTGEPGEDGPVEVVITNRTYIYVHARTRDGQDLHNVETESSPSRNSERGRLAMLNPEDPQFQEQRTNFSNITIGSFISVRYESVGGVNQALNVNLIEFPLGEPAGGAGGVGGAAGVASENPPGVPAGTDTPIGNPQSSVPTTRPAGVVIPR